MWSVSLRSFFLAFSAFFDIEVGEHSELWIGGNDVATTGSLFVYQQLPCGDVGELPSGGSLKLSLAATATAAPFHDDADQMMADDQDASIKRQIEQYRAEAEGARLNIEHVNCDNKRLKAELQRSSVEVDSLNRQLTEAQSELDMIKQSSLDNNIHYETDAVLVDTTLIDPGTVFFEYVAAFMGSGILHPN